MVKYRSFRKFIFDSYHDRFDEMLNTVDSIAFMNMDQRLMKYLLDKKQSTGSFVINKTHEQIAQELNTSRVVVSRLLKKLEREEKIELHRNRIEVLWFRECLVPTALLSLWHILSTNMLPLKGLRYLAFKPSLKMLIQAEGFGVY